jgi:hypothetical protein
MFDKNLIYGILISILILCIYHIVSCQCNDGFQVGGEKYGGKHRGKHGGKQRRKLEKEIIQLEREISQVSDTCDVGETVKCEEGGVDCAGNQCCPDGSTCPSADNSFTGCLKEKVRDCTEDSPPEECKGLTKLKCLKSDKCLHIDVAQGKEICIEKNKDCGAILDINTCNDSKECTFKKDKCMSDCGMYSTLDFVNLFRNKYDKYICPSDCYDSSLTGANELPGNIGPNSCTFFCDDLDTLECNIDPKCKIENNTCTERKCNDQNLNISFNNGRDCENILGCTYNDELLNLSKCQNSCNNSTVFKNKKKCNAWSNWQTQRESNYKLIIDNIESSRGINNDRYINYHLCEWNNEDGQCNIKSKI